MKRVFRFTPVLLVAFMATAAFGQIVPGDPSTYPSVSVVNTPHNLNNYPGVTVEGNQVCLPCHTPHHAVLPGEDNVLWNHAETTQTFTLYSSTAGQPEGASKMCLSCHDGVTALDSYGGATGTVPLTGDANVGTDLSDDHPIGIEYPAADTANYRDPSTFAPGINSGPGVHLVEINSVERVECTSCHQVHNNGLGDFLNVPVLESYLCLQCHIK